MSDENNNNEPTDDYEVGYGKPPKKSQFKPGQSGNPKGRPKKTKDLQKLFALELDKTVKVTENGELKRLTMLEAFVRSVISGALKGERDARKMLFAVIEKQPDLDGLVIDDAAEAMLQRFLDKKSPESGANDVNG